jgi:large subunit ribosomal protein L25
MVAADATNREPVAADLIIVRRGEKTTVDVPVIVVGEPAPDTIPNHQLNTVSIEADATKLPDSIEVDITGRAAGENISAGDLSLPSGATLVTDPEALVIGFLGAPSAAELEAELAEAEAEAGIEREESGEAGEGDVVPEPQDQGSGESTESAGNSADNG